MEIYVPMTLDISTPVRVYGLDLEIASVWSLVNERFEDPEGVNEDFKASAEQRYRDSMSTSRKVRT